MEFNERSAKAGEQPSPSDPVSGTIANREPSLPAVIGGRVGKFGIAQRARLLGRLLASVGPLALKVVSGGVFAKYVRQARSTEIPVSFDDAANATPSQLGDLVHYVEQSNPALVQELSASLSSNEANRHSDQAPLAVQPPAVRNVRAHASSPDAPGPSRSAPGIEPKDPPARLGPHHRELHDY